VGTTNRTRLEDYRRAIGPETGALLKVHPSNFRVEGFTSEAGYRDLAALSAETGVRFVADLGSGLLDQRVPWLGGVTPPWLEGEPGMRQVLEAGADLVLCSGDKLLGGPQAGIIAGRSAVVADLAAHPLARAVRIGGPPLAALAATLDLYARGRGHEIPFWRMASLPATELERRSEDVVAAAGVGSVVPGHSLPGAGSAPGRGIPGPVVALPGGESARHALLAGDPPVLSRLEREQLVIDLRAVDPGDDPLLIEAISTACR
jgi:L-seryl-tRNA(Ser) seleniumtransferase